LFYEDIAKHVGIFSSTGPYVSLPGGLQLSVLWLYLLGNVCTQWLCSRGVFNLMGTLLAFCLGCFCCFES
jgi:hypothetical protein